MPDDSPVTLPIQCKTCGAALTMHLDQWNPERRSRQNYACPACTKLAEGIFQGRIVRVTRRWDT